MVAILVHWDKIRMSNRIQNSNFNEFPPKNRPQRFFSHLWVQKNPLGGNGPRAGLTAATVVWYLAEIRVLMFANEDRLARIFGSFLGRHQITLFKNAF